MCSRVLRIAPHRSTRVTGTPAADAARPMTWMTSVPRRTWPDPWQCAGSETRSPHLRSRYRAAGEAGNRPASTRRPWISCGDTLVRSLTTVSRTLARVGFVQRVAQNAAQIRRDDLDQLVELPCAVVLDQHLGDLADEAPACQLVRVVAWHNGMAGDRGALEAAARPVGNQVLVSAMHIHRGHLAQHGQPTLIAGNPQARAPDRHRPRQSTTGPVACDERGRPEFLAT